MKIYDINTVEKIMSEVKEFIKLKQKEFYEDNKEWFPLMYLEEGDKGWYKIRFEKEFYIIKRCTMEYYSQLIKDKEIEKKFEQILENGWEYDELWKVANDLVQEKLKWLSHLIEAAKAKKEEYLKRIEENEIYSEFVNLRIKEKLKK